MAKVGFNEAVETILSTDTRYDREAYLFLRDALDYTTKSLKRSGEGPARHVTPVELLDGVRQYALKEFGPMTLTVLSYWGVRRSEDIGAIVFNLIEAGVFGRADTDSVEDFANGYDFAAAFVVPFKAGVPASEKSSNAESRGVSVPVRHHA